MKTLPFIILVFLILFFGCKEEKTIVTDVKFSGKCIKISGIITNWTKQYYAKYDIYETGINGEIFKDSNKVNVSPDGYFTFVFPYNGIINNWNKYEDLGNFTRQNAEENTIELSSPSFHFATMSLTLIEKGDITFKPKGKICKWSHFTSEDYTVKNSPLTIVEYVYFERNIRIHGTLKEQLWYLPRVADIVNNHYNLSFKKGWNILVTHKEYSRDKYKSKFNFNLSELRIMRSNIDSENTRWYVQVYNPFHIGWI